MVDVDIVNTVDRAVGERLKPFYGEEEGRVIDKFGGIEFLAQRHAPAFHKLSFDDQKRATLVYFICMSSDIGGPFFRPRIAFQEYMDPEYVAGVHQEIKLACIVAVQTASDQDALDRILQTHICPGGVPTGFRFTREEDRDMEYGSYVGHRIASRDSMVNFEVERIKSSILDMHGCSRVGMSASDIVALLLDMKCILV